MSKEKLEKRYRGLLKAIVRAKRKESGGQKIVPFNRDWTKRQARHATVAKRAWPIKTNIEKDILDGMARLAWSDHVANYLEESGRMHAGQQLYKYKPASIPARARKWAREVAMDLLFQEKASSLQELYDLVVTKYEYEGNAEQFGNDLAYEALGHGVNWRDRLKRGHRAPSNVIDVPNHEFAL